MQAALAGAFQRLYHHQAWRTWKDTWYRGTRLHAYPTDLWVYQELVEELRPSLVVQTGTFRGGTALLLADRLQVLGRGRVVTVDAEIEPRRPQHPRLTYLTGRPADPATVREVTALLDGTGPVLALLGAGSTAEEVRAEIEAYAPLLPAGSALVVEHTHLPGPAAALRDFLAGTTDFEIDPAANGTTSPRTPPASCAASRAASRSPPATGPGRSGRTPPARRCARWRGWRSTATGRRWCWSSRPSRQASSSPGSAPRCSLPRHLAGGARTSTARRGRHAGARQRARREPGRAGGTGRGGRARRGRRPGCG